MKEDDSLKSEYAKSRPRDSEGHFLSEEEIEEAKKQSSNPFLKILDHQTSFHKGTDDELLDIHIGNPLRRITELLEQIKKQKAFSFTLKGSLGIMGVVLVAGTFGILGGSKVFCDKGTQTKIGEVVTLSYKENSEMGILKYLPFADSLFPDRKIARNVLIGSGNEAIHLISKNGVSFKSPISGKKILTGSYDSCSMTLTVDQQDGVQEYLK